MDKLSHLGAQKINYNFSFTISNLDLFETAFKESKIDPDNKDQKFGVIFIISKYRFHGKEVTIAVNQTLLL